jgi:hypothetical protein
MGSGVFQRSPPAEMVRRGARAFARRRTMWKKLVSPKGGPEER